MTNVVEEGKIYGVPVYRWIGGRERVTVPVQPERESERSALV